MRDNPYREDREELKRLHQLCVFVEQTADIVILVLHNLEPVGDTCNYDAE